MIGQVHDVDLRLLRVFRSVARCGGLAAARAELNLSLPTISLQVKQLEERLGIRLCRRGSTGFAVTTQGEAVLRATERLLASVDEFDARVAALTETPTGEVRLGVTANLMSNPACRIHDAIARIHATAPGLSVTLFVGSPAELESSLLGGTVHVAVGLLSGRQATLECTELFAERHILYCAAGNPLFGRAGNDEFDVASLHRASYVGWAHLDAFVHSPVPLEPRTASPFLDGIACLILSGQHVGYLPEYFAAPWVAQSLLRPVWIDHTARTAPVLLVRRRADASNRPVTLLVETLLATHGAQGPDDGRPPA